MSKRTSTRLLKKKVHFKESSSDESDSEEPIKSKPKLDTLPTELKLSEDDSSSDSDIGTTLKTSDKIDLNSPFFEIKKLDEPKEEPKSCEDEKLDYVDRLSDSDDESDDNQDQVLAIQPSTSSENVQHSTSAFDQLENYKKELEETKNKIMNMSKSFFSKEENVDINSLLAQGETGYDENTYLNFSEEEDDGSGSDMEEVKPGIVENKPVIPSLGVQITLDLPNPQKEKKKVDVMAQIKRKINRVKKEYQIYIHKVHLLCWIAHGHYVNKILNSEKLLALSLSLIPNENCYPSGRIDLSYVEQITTWFNKTFTYNVTTRISVDNYMKGLPLDKALHVQIMKKKADSKKNFILIFICMLRAIGVQCRMILSFRVAPLRPPSHELCSLSTKTNTKAPAKNIKAPKPIPQIDGHNDPEKRDKLQPKVRRNDSAVSSSPEVGTTRRMSRCKKSPEVTDDDSTDTEHFQKHSLSVRQSRSDKKRVVVKSSFSQPTVTKASNGESSNGQNLKQNANKNLKGKKLESSKKTDLKKTEAAKKDVKPKRSQSENSRPEPQEMENETTRTRPPPKRPRFRSLMSRDIDKKETVKSSFSQPTETKTSNQKEKSSKVQNSKESAPESLTGKKAESFKTPSKEKKTDNQKKESSTKTGTSKAAKPKRSQSENSRPQQEDNEIRKRPPPKRPRCRSQMSRGESSSNVPEKSPIKKSPTTHSSFFNKPSTSTSVVGDIIHLVKSRISEQKDIDKRKLVPKKKTQKKHSDDDDSDYAPEPVKKKIRKSMDSDDDFDVTPKQRPKTKVDRLKKNNRKVLSDSETDSKETLKIGNDVWVEVYLEDEEKWISVDVLKGQVHCTQELFSRATQPVAYIVGWKNDGTLKDVTSRYCVNWNTVTRKLRVDPAWWEETLRPYIGKKTARDREEDEELAQLQIDQPLPKVISEYKNHPLYVLKRHLLKFEALYPPDAVTLGFVRNEPVFARECVYTLHSRETWVKQAKVVKPGEKPYKIVKARPKYDRLTGNVTKDIPLEIFGPWQVKDYEPPVAENGVVPRNPYGNVDLFKPCMLPVGTVHLQLPGLNRIARKLRIDCAPAMIGFDYHSGGSHPTFDGYVVCKEHEETLMEAWEQEQEEAEKRAQEKVEKRVYDNWKRLIKGLLIRERLKRRYQFGDSEKTDDKKKKPKGPKFTAKKQGI